MKFSFCNLLNVLDMLKSINLFLLIILISAQSHAQVGIGTISPHETSILEVQSSNKGFLPPRMSTNDRNMINGGNFAEGLMIFNTDDQCINFYNGSKWINPCATPPDPLPANMNINTENQIRYIASVLDDEYLPFTIPTTEANTNRTPIGAGNENTINIEGILTTTGLTVTLPYSATGSPTFSDYSYTVSVPANLTQDNTGRDVIFEYTGGTAMDNGEIIMTIRSVGGDLKLLQLDLENGLGNGTSTTGNIPNAYGILIAEAPIIIDEIGTTRYIQLRNIPGVPDRNFGDGSHNCLYLPITIADGSTWLNNNLGASYADVTNPNFNIAQQATSGTDELANGSLIQWGRKSDGHELVTWSSGNFTPVNPNTQSATGNTNTNPNHSDFYVGEHIWFGTLATLDQVEHNKLWGGPNGGVNNPCPYGYKVPSSADWNSASTIPGTPINFSTIGSASDPLKLTVGKWRYQDGSIQPATYVLYWTDALVPTPPTADQSARAFAIVGGTVNPINNNTPGNGFKLRCIQE